METTSPHDYAFGPNAERDYLDSLNAARGIVNGVAISFAFWTVVAVGVCVAPR